MAWWPFGRERRIRCPDGSYRYVFKNPHHAFPLIAQEWITKATASADTLNQLKGEVSGEIASRIGGLLFQLDSKNASVQQKCCATYVVYKVDPCGKDAWLEQEVKQILAEESFLRRLDAIVEQIRAAIDGDLPAMEILQRLDAFSRILQLSDSDLRRIEIFRNAPQLAKEWTKEPKE